ncbi:MAG: ABC transporter permease [Thermoleophilia bacterium]|nr:ABC transporter permease [Thermoleophilia bacterium]
MEEVDRSDELVVTSHSRDSNRSLPDRDVIVLEPKRGWASLDLRHLWDYRELLFFLTWRDILLRYKQAVLGVAWAIMQPLLTMVVFTVVFNKGLKVETGDEDLPYAVFSFCGLLPWQFFAGALTRSTTSVVGNANLVTKVYFPRLVIPISAVLGVLVDFVLSFIVLLILMAAYGIAPGWEIAVLPAFVVLIIATALSVGLWMSAINVLYRDVQYIIPFLVQLWMFVSPVIYPLDPKWPEWLRVLFSLNPMTGVINGFRWSLLGSPFDARYLGISTAVVFVLLVGGLFYFRRIERMFADVV